MRALTGRIAIFLALGLGIPWSGSAQTTAVGDPARALRPALEPGLWGPLKPESGLTDASHLLRGLSVDLTAPRPSPGLPRPLGLRRPARQDTDSIPWVGGRLAIAEMLMGNFLPWIGVEYGMVWKDITRMSPHSWIERGLQWTFDDNHFSVNLFMHPFQGSFYFNAWRSNGYSYWESMGGTALGSFLWELGGESHRGSPNDFIMTTLGGAMLGEATYRLGTMLLGGPNAGRKELREWGITVLTLPRGFTRWVSGRRGEKPIRTHEPRTQEWFLTLGAGGSWVGPDTNLQTDRFGAFFTEVYVGLNSALGLCMEDGPVTQFTASLQMGGGPGPLVGRGHFRANLHQLRAEEGDACQIQEDRSEAMPAAVKSRIYLYQGMDYMDFSGIDDLPEDDFQFGGPTFGVVWADQISFPDRYRSRLTWSLEAHTRFAAVRSEHASLWRNGYDRETERVREYDFTVGGGPSVRVQLSHGERPRLDAGFGIDWLRTVNGSNQDPLRGPGSRSSHHRVMMGDVRLNLPLVSTVGFGFDALWFKRQSSYRTDVYGERLRPSKLPWGAQYRAYLTFEPRTTRTRAFWR